MGINIIGITSINKNRAGCRISPAPHPGFINLHSTHGGACVILPFGTEVFGGAILHRAVIDDTHQPSSQICRISSQTTKIRLGIIEIQNCFFEVFCIRSCSCEMALPNPSLILPACRSIDFIVSCIVTVVFCASRFSVCRYCSRASALACPSSRRI